MWTKAIVFAVLTFISSCTWFCPPTPTGTLYGSSMLITPQGTALTDHSGIKVTASTEGIAISTTTDVNGRWELKELPSGTYAISFAKAGYGMNKISAHIFAAPGKDRIANTINLFPLPQYDVTSVAVALQPGQVTVSGTLSGVPTGYRLVGLFFGLSQSVSASPSEYLYVSWVSANTNTFSVAVSSAAIKNAGAPAGATIYVTGYAASNGVSYVDVETGRQVYYNLSATHSNTASFVIQ